MKWVKASEEQPKCSGVYFCKVHSKGHPELTDKVSIDFGYDDEKDLWEWDLSNTSLIISEWLNEEPEQEQDMEEKLREYSSNRIKEAPKEAIYRKVEKPEKESLKEGSPYYQLFKFFSDEHNLTLTDGEIQDILCAVEQFNKSQERESDIENIFAGKWKLIGHCYQIADTGDYDGHWEITDGKISLLTKDDNDESLSELVKVFNKCDCEFYQENAAERELAFIKSNPEWQRQQPQPNSLDACRFLNWSNDFEWRFEYRNGLGYGWVNGEKFNRRFFTTEELYNGPYKQYLKYLNEKQD